MDIKRKISIARNKLNLKIQDRLFPDYSRTRHIGTGLDVISLGSRPGLYALDFNGSGINGFNLAVMPQTVEYDYRMLRNYHSYLGKDGKRIVLLPLCPFSLLKKRYGQADGELALDHRYYLILHHAMVNNYSEVLYQQIRHRPLMYMAGHPRLIKGAVSNRQNKALAADCRCSGEQLEASAKKYTDGWRREFKIEDFSRPLTSRLKEAIEYNQNILADLMQFCSEREITPIAIIPPLSRQLMSLMPESFLNEALYAPLNKIGLRTVDYSKDPALTTDAAFYDALCLNVSGRKAFTNEIKSLLDK